MESGEPSFATVLSSGSTAMRCPRCFDSISGPRQTSTSSAAQSTAFSPSADMKEHLNWLYLENRKAGGDGFESERGHLGRLSAKSGSAPRTLCGQGCPRSHVRPIGFAWLPDRWGLS